MQPSASESQKSLPSFTPLLQTRPLQAVPIQSRSSTTSTSPSSGSRPCGTRLSSLTPTTIAQGPSPSPSSSQTTSVRREKNMPAKRGQGVANYNELRQREGGPSVSSPVQATGLANYTHQAIPVTPYSSAVVPGTGSSNSSSVVFTRNSVDRGSGSVVQSGGFLACGSTSASNSSPPPAAGFGGAGQQPGFMEGPLPSEVREIIRRSCTGEKAEEAEREARRLLSTSRRLRVYREEMAAAQEEMSDAKTECERQNLVTSALTDEIMQINHRIEELMKERSICEQQLSQMQSVGAHREKKYAEARERVNILGNTIDNINRETSMGYLMLRQLVPNLNIENYA